MKYLFLCLQVSNVNQMLAGEIYLFFFLALDSLRTSGFVFSHIIEKGDKVREFGWSEGSLVRAVV